MLHHIAYVLHTVRVVQGNRYAGHNIIAIRQSGPGDQVAVGVVMDTASVDHGIGRARSDRHTVAGIVSHLTSYGDHMGPVFNLEAVAGVLVELAAGKHCILIIACIASFDRGAASGVRMEFRVAESKIMNIITDDLTSCVTGSGAPAVAECYVVASWISRQMLELSNRH